MKYFHAFICCVLVSISLQAQNIKLLNKHTKQPIFGVAIYNVDKSKSEVTNFLGEAILDNFLEDEVIYFKHLSYVLKTTTKRDLKSNNKLYLIPNTQDLSEIVISTSKFEQSKRDIPQKVLTMTAENIEFSNPQTSADLLGNMGEVYIQKSQMGGGSPMIRGFSTNRLLITVDGVRMNNAIFRGGNLQNVISIDPLAVESAEVILGPGSVIYGSDAIGGVMSFYTQKPQLSYSDSLQLRANFFSRYATANNEKTGHFDFNIGLKKWGFLTSFSYSNFDDLMMGSHGPDDYLRPEYIVTTDLGDEVIQNDEPRIQRFSGYNQLNVMQKVLFKPNDALSFDLGVFYTTTSDVPRYDRLLRYRDGELRSAEWNYGPQEWFMTNLQMTKVSNQSRMYDRLKATIAYQNFKESRMDRDFQSSLRNVRKESVDAYSVNLDFEKTLSPKTQFYYGLEYVFNAVKSSARTENIENGMTSPTVTRYPNDATWQSSALYSSIKYKPNPNFVFQSGLRYNYVISNARFEENNVYLNLPFVDSNHKAGALTGTAGISWTPNKLLQWKLNANTAFRAPNIDDIGKIFDSEPGSVVVPNDDLRPEYAYGGELGLKLNFDKKVVLDLNTYYTYLDNALVRRDYYLNGEQEIMYDGELSNVQAIQNASKAWIYGFEADLKVRLSNTFKLTSQYSIIGGTEQAGAIEVPVRHVAPSFGNTHLIFVKNRVKLDAFINFNGALSFDQLAPSEVLKDYIYASDENGNPYAPSWYTLNLRGQYQLTNVLTLTSSLENITNQRYRTYSSGIAATGINFIMALKYNL